MTINKMFREYGREVFLANYDEWNSEIFHALIQPLRYKNKMYLGGVNTPIGHNSEGHYLYIGPASHDLTALENDVWVQAGDDKYKIDRAERVYLKGEVIYIWAVIRIIVEV